MIHLVSSKTAIFSLTLAALVLAACKGEDRPEVDVIGGNGSASVSVSASGAGPESAGGATPTASRTAAAGAGGTTPASGAYNPVSNVDSYFQMGLDLRDMRAVMASAAQGGSVDWAAVTAIYGNGKNQVAANGTTRSLASIPNDSVQAVFPNGSSVYGRSNFIDLLIRDGLAGTRRAQGLPDDARRQIVDKGVQILMYGKALQELESAKTRVAAKNLDNATGAPHAVDEAWGAIAGAADDKGERPYGLLATATGREGNFKLEGKLRAPLESAFVAALAASQKGDAAAFDKAHADIKGYLNATFYLGVLRYGRPLEGDTTEAQRQGHLAEGWAFWQTIRAAVAGASSSAAQVVEAAYTRPAAQAFPASETTRIYAALNEPAVLRALGVPAALQVKSPPAQ